MKRMIRMIRPEDLPIEFDLRTHGYVMRGWGFSREELADAINSGRMLNLTFEGMGNYCPWNCDYCYTERDSGLDARKRRLVTELPLARRLEIIREAADLGVRSMNFIGAGEPTLDPNFWDLVECVAGAGMVPIVFSEASFRLTNRVFAQRLYDIGATVVIKVNSLWNADYQNALVAGNQAIRSEYFDRRNQAIELCLETGFANETPTRLGFDTIITKDNYAEIPHLHHYARDHNIFVVLKNFLHTGRAKELRSDAVKYTDQVKLWEHLAEIDEHHFGIKHASCFPFGGGTPCNLCSTGVHMSIKGEVFRCDGEETPLGDLRTESLATIWHRVRGTDQNIEGLCPPRERAFLIESESILAEDLRVLFYKQVRSLKFSVRVDNCLRKAEIRFVGELIQKSEQDLMQLRNFGRKCLVEVRGKLSSLGMGLDRKCDVDRIGWKHPTHP